MKKIFAVLIGTQICVSLQAQLFTREFINNWVSKRDSSFRWADRVLYIFNNFPYDTLQIDSILNRWAMGKIADFTYLKSSDIKSYHPGPGMIIINGKQQLKKDEIIYQLKRANLLMQNDSSQPNPMVYLNDFLLDNKQAMKVLNSIKWDEIYWLDVTDKDCPNSFVGQYSKFGLIRISTKSLTD